MRALLVGTVLAMTALLFHSWFSVGYLAQAALGQLQIAGAARPLEAAAADEALPVRTRRLLAAVPGIKAYGLSQGLKPTTNYERYADLRRSAAAWVVQGCAPLSFEVKRWTFPVVGSVPYLGFFDERSARRYAETLSTKEALDVDVRTASAFSTLGWFHDPVLSTMIGQGDEAVGELANLVLHESVHATLYVNDQSSFNESLASFVADRLTVPWLETAFGPEAPETKAWIAVHRRERARVARLHRAYHDLDAVYRSAESETEKVSEKRRILATASEELHLARPLNNAAVAGYKAYDTGVPAFERLLRQCGGSWPRLMKTVGTISPSDFARPQRDDFEDVVDRLATTTSGCAG